jgi:hypothetical protein
MMSEAREVLAGSDEDEGLLESPQMADTNAYLTPLQKSLFYELTTRRARIADADSRAEFWHKRQSASHKDKFQLDVLDDDFFDRNIVIRRKELMRLREAVQLKEAVVQS